MAKYANLKPTKNTAPRSWTRNISRTLIPPATTLTFGFTNPDFLNNRFKTHQPAVGFEECLALFFIFNAGVGISTQPFTVQRWCSNDDISFFRVLPDAVSIPAGVNNYTFSKLNEYGAPPVAIAVLPTYYSFYYLARNREALWPIEIEATFTLRSRCR